MLMLLRKGIGSKASGQEKALPLAREN